MDPKVVFVCPPSFWSPEVSLVFSSVGNDVDIRRLFPDYFSNFVYHLCTSVCPTQQLHVSPL